MRNAEMAVQLDMPNGESRVIEIGRFSAMGGWDIQSRYAEFVASKDGTLRRAYTLEVLSHAFVVVGDGRMPINTAAVVENHLQSWPAIREVFNAVLTHNGIDPDAHADRPGYWTGAGSEMAIAFVAEVAARISPMMESMREDQTG